MGDDGRIEIEREADEQDKLADQAREHAGEAAAAEREGTPLREYGGDAPEQVPEGKPPRRQ
jgi:hypothetical protein